MKLYIWVQVRQLACFMQFKKGHSRISVDTSRTSNPEIMHHVQFPYFSMFPSFSAISFYNLHLLTDFKFLLHYFIQPFFVYSVLIYKFINTFCFIFLFFLLLFSFSSYIFLCTFVPYLSAYLLTLIFFISCSYFGRLLMSSPYSVFSSSLQPVSIYSCKKKKFETVRIYAMLTNRRSRVYSFTYSQTWQ